VDAFICYKQKCEKVVSLNLAHPVGLSSFVKPLRSQSCKITRNSDKIWPYSSYISYTVRTFNQHPAYSVTVSGRMKLAVAE